MIQGEQECFFCFLKISRVGVFLINGQTTQSLCGRPKKTLEKKQKTNSRTKTKRKLASLDDKIKKKAKETKENEISLRRAVSVRPTRDRMNGKKEWHISNVSTESQSLVAVSSY